MTAVEYGVTRPIDVYARVGPGVLVYGQNSLENVFFPDRAASVACQYAEAWAADTREEVWIMPVTIVLPVSAT